MEALQDVTTGDRAVIEAAVRPEQVSYSLDIVGVSKQFRRNTVVRAGYTTVKSSLLGLFLPRKRAPRRVTRAIRDLTMRIPKGASVGVIGKNGSGKSTLLKLISGIYKPDQGTIRVNGRVAALIELGAGFHPDFSGRENLYLGGVMHGLSRTEIDQRFEEIVSFAELGDVIDDPVRTYSSGMFMRLGFSLAIHTDPEVLLVDEVLAVGDAAFVGKCKEKLAELRRQQRTLLLVTHDLESVERWCDEVLWLEQGEVRDRGEPRRVIDHYRQFIEKGEELELMGEAEAQGHAAASDFSLQSEQLESSRWGSREIEVTGVRLVDHRAEGRLVFHPDDAAEVQVDYCVREDVADVVFGIAINRSDGLVAHGSNTDIERISIGRLGKRGHIRYRIKRLGLSEGLYTIDVAVHRQDGYPYDYHKAAVSFKVRSALNFVGYTVPEHSWSFDVAEY